AVPSDQRRGAGLPESDPGVHAEMSVSERRAQPGAVWEAVPGTAAGELRGPAGQLLAILLLAVRAGLGSTLRSGDGAVHGAGVERCLGALEVGSASRHCRAGAARDAV